MTRRERLTRAARGQEVDRIPTLGGWIGGALVLADLAGRTPDEYLANPFGTVLAAHSALDVDGMVPPVVPAGLDAVRTGHVLDSAFEGVEPEAIVRYAETLPTSEDGVLAGFDHAAEEARYRAFFEGARRDWLGMEPVPNFWEIGGHFPLYTQFGYTAFLIACAIYPEALGHIWWARSVVSRERARILAGLYSDMELVPVMFCGEDLCNNQGPMVSPAMLRKHYLPTVRMILEPLVDAGVRLVHHCDGDVRPMLRDFIDCGFSGFQGFQYECGIDLKAIREMRSLRGEEPILFAGLSVSRTLPFGTEEEVRAEVDRFIEATDGGRGLFLFTSNVTGVEVPPANIRAGYHHAATTRPSGWDRV